MKISIALLLCLLLFSNCATIWKGSNENVDIESVPDSAKVYLNGNYVGKTPMSIELKSSGTHQITIGKDGYESKTTYLTGSVYALWVLWDVVWGVAPVLFDWITASWYELNEGNIEMILDKKN
jgi:hypothetical protein